MPRPQPSRMTPLEVRAIRESLGADMTQGRFAEMLRVSRQTVSRWESGLATISEFTASAIRGAAARYREQRRES